ncbi:hypothetical protein [Facklamia hominis]|uniref:hypothetical protein n=1 Tax=Facklamia hominis TaxID=178214 RepID=UPI0038FC5FD3
MGKTRKADDHMALLMTLEMNEAKTSSQPINRIERFIHHSLKVIIDSIFEEFGLKDKGENSGPIKVNCDRFR